MKDLYLQPTSTAQWYSLVNEAQIACRLQLGEDLESYLVFLLMRFSEKPELFHSIIAIEFLESLKKTGRLRDTSLQEIGDKCLLIAGFFPDLVKKRCLHKDYYIDLGQNAYWTLSSNLDINSADLFKNLSEDFILLRNVLLTMKHEETNRDAHVTPYFYSSP